MHYASFHFQFALDRSHRFEKAATEHRAITRADPAAMSYAVAELSVLAPISSRTRVRSSSSAAA